MAMGRMAFKKELQGGKKKAKPDEGPAEQAMDAKMGMPEMQDEGMEKPTKRPRGSRGAGKGKF